VRLTYQYLGFLFGILDISDMAVSAVYLCLVVLDFRASEFIYDKILNELLMANEKVFHRFFKYIHQVMENTIYAFLRACKDILFAFLSGIIPKLPDLVRYPLDMIGVTAFLDKSVSSSLNEKKKKDKDYLEYAKKLEKNRPMSPAHGPSSITIPDFSSETKKVYDPLTKQFKVVPVDD